MASIEYRARTTRVIAYVNKTKQTFSLGRVNRKTAERFANNIDTLLHEHRCNLPISREVSIWLSDLDESLYGLLVQHGLVEPRMKAGTLSSFIESYITARTDVTERRLGKLRNAKERLLEFFGDVSLDSVTAGAADDYARWLLTKVSATTAHKECQIAAQFFRHAYRKRFIERSPFDGVAVGQSTNDSRRQFISREVIERVISKCPNWQWKTVVALARYGGLRCPSEVALLRWSDVHWDTDRFTVTSVKTARYGKATRIVPIFPSLRPYLDKAFSEAKEGETWVVPMLGGNADKNLGTTFRKIIRRAGVDGWLKPFQNLRASCQSELEQHFPTFVVCAWLGNTPKIAHKHYLTLTEDHFAAAIKTGDQLGTQTLAGDGKCPQALNREPYFVPENARFSEIAGLLDARLVAEEGLELRLSFQGKTYILAIAGDPRGTIRTKPP